MLKRLSSLILVLLVCGSILAGTARPRDEHVCEMAGVETMPGMEAMPCCKEHESPAVSNESDSQEQCCITIPEGPGSSGTTFKLRQPSFRIAVIHPAIMHSPMTLPKPYECSYSAQVFLPNLQASYIRNLFFLI